jgi:hypothetical protein
MVCVDDTYNHHDLVNAFQYFSVPLEVVIVPGPPPMTIISQHLPRLVNKRFDMEIDGSQTLLRHHTSH